ncbi:MAG: efflux RND transporter periplasmic adaptor subunit [Magnetococcales bacterium]|nr:efflux RND transporter periplasmic adaptor subunit [Magnetococcales bacterium]
MTELKQRDPVNRPAKNSSGGVDYGIIQLRALRQFSGAPREFWSYYLVGVGGLCGAQRCTILTGKADNSAIKDGEAPKEAGWQVLSTWNDDSQNNMKLPMPSQTLLNKAMADGMVVESANSTGEATNPASVSPGRILIRLDIGPGQPSVVMELVSRQPLVAKESTLELIFRLKLVADIPAAYQLSREYQQARRDVVRVAEVLDLTGRLQADSSYQQAAMTICNELAAKFKCSQVSMGWVDDQEYVSLESISHMWKFDRKMVMAQALESAMEEALDQDTEIVLPQADGRTEVTLAHDTYARERSLKYVVTLPIRHSGNQLGVFCCERTDEPFVEFDIWSLRLFVDHTASRLVELKRNDLWIGAKVAEYMGKLTAPIWGAEHFVAKILGLLTTSILIIVLMTTWPYRVESPFLLKTDDTYTTPAPFDGYIDDVKVKEGDLVQKKSILAKLDVRKLQMEKSSTLAEISQYTLEAENFRSQKDLAQMRIARAKQEQALSRFDQVSYQIKKALIRSPIQGVVVEGDLQKLLGAPVRQGDALFRVASLEKMYVTIDVDERDIHEIEVGMVGQVAFIGRPQEHFNIVVEKIQSVAQVRDGRNVFTVRAKITEEKVASWWRPGMSGVVKLDVGDRRIVWILTHRTVEFLRMLTWW